MGVILKVQAVYNVRYDYIDHFRVPQIVYGRLLVPEKTPMQKKLMEAFLGFCCHHCGYVFTPKENREIFQYLRKRKVLDQLRKPKTC